MDDDDSKKNDEEEEGVGVESNVEFISKEEMEKLKELKRRVIGMDNEYVPMNSSDQAIVRNLSLYTSQPTNQHTHTHTIHTVEIPRSTKLEYRQS
jgi:hypothetical protein